MAPPKGHVNYNIKGDGRPRIYDDVFIEKETDALYKWMATTECVFLKEFAFERGYSPKHLSLFAKRNHNFQEALDLGHEWMETRLAKGGLFKEFEGGFAKFVMARTCGWREEKTINLKASDDSPEWLKSAVNQSKELIKND